MGDGSDNPTKKIDEETLSKIVSDLQEIKMRLRDLENIKNRLTTLEQIQMKIISGEIQVGQGMKPQPPPPSPPVDMNNQENTKNDEFEVVGYSSDRDNEKIFTFPDAEPDPRAAPQETSEEYDYELEDLPELIPVEAEPVQESEFDDLEYGCPFCGATVGAFATMCPGCGHELEEEEDNVERDKIDSSSQHDTLENYYRSKSSGNYTETNRDDNWAERQSTLTSSRQVNKFVEVEPIHSQGPGASPEIQLSRYARGQDNDSPPVCEFCDKPTRYIKEYGRWYCYGFKKYSKSRAKPVEIPDRIESRVNAGGAGQGKKPLKDYPRYSK